MENRPVVLTAASAAEAGDATFVLADDQRLVAAFRIARHLDINRAIVGKQGLAAGAIALASLATRLGLTAKCSVISTLIARSMMAFFKTR